MLQTSQSCNAIISRDRARVSSVVVMAAGREIPPVSSFQVGRYNLSKNDQPQDQSELAVLGLDGVLKLQDTKTG